MKYVLITGASGGMGLITAKKFIDNGYHVFGLDIINPKEELGNFTFFKVDLTKKEEIDHVFELISEKDIKLDLIINTAGIYNLDSLVEIKEEDFIKIFNINVFAIYRINKIFLPLLKEKGRIIVISSELGPLDPLPFTGLYAITKSTIEKYVYSLRMELQLLDIKVILIRPGAVDTGLLDVSTTALEKFINKTDLYSCNAKKFKNIVDSVEARKIKPIKIANLIYKVANKKYPRYVYSINRNPLLIILNALPHSLQNNIIKSILKK